MDWKVTLTITVTILLAFSGYAATYWNNLRLAQRRDRLDRINRQLSDLYGPLLALSIATESLFKEYGREHASKLDEHATWRVWVQQVFMPLNERMVEVITEKADLIEEPEMPEVLRQLCAHVNAYRPIITNWEKSDFSRRTPLVRFPASLHKDVEKVFSRLKKEQNDLLRRELPNSKS